MSITHDEAGNDFHAVALGLRPTRSIVNYRDASGGTGGAWQKNPTPIPHPGRHGQNPWGNGRLKSNDGKAATSSSSQRALKRQKLDHRKGDTPSKYFPKMSSEPRTRGQRAQAGLSSSPSRLARAADAIVIDEDDTSDAGESSSKPVTLKTSSPDPMDIITPETAYTFDQSKPSPIDQFSSSLEELHRSPTDGESTARLRTLRQTEARNPTFRPNGDSQSAKAPVSHRIGQADRSPGMGHVGRMVSVYEEHDYRRIDLQAQHRKKNMKPRQPQRQMEKLPITLQDPYATRSSGFVSGPGPSKGKTTRKSVVCSLPLERWSIGVDVPPHEATPYPPANLIWDQNGLLKVQHADSSTLFELCFNKKSFGSLQYTHLKTSSSAIPLIQIYPLGTATIRSSMTNGFKLGSDDANGLLTFKFDPDASDWDLKLYLELVRDLQRALVSKDGKSVLDRPGAKAVWEAVMRARGDRSTKDRIGSLPPDNHPKEVPDSVTKPRPRPKPRTEVAPMFDIVRRSARLSGAEQQRFSPKPDPDEVILAYRSGAGSLNITNGDVSRLKPGEFLNDTLIEFGLKLWLADLHESNPELATQVHVFSSFFYKKLSTKVPEEGYNSVRKWTSKFDLFQKKYIIVPINENMHWYLAIICFPEYTLLPRPKQVTNIRRRSTRRSGGADFSGVKDLEPTSKQSPPPPPHPDPSPSAQADSASASGLITPVSPRTDDQREEIVVERMVESGGPLPELLAKQSDEHVQVVDKDAPVDDATGLEDSLTLLYPGSSPHVQRTELPSLDQQVDVIEQEGHPASISVSEGGSARDSGIPPTTFYGQSDHRRRNVTSPEISPVDNGPSVEIVVEEDVIMANPDSEHEEAVEHSQTYIFTFDSLSSKHPQAVKRLGKYLLMEAHDKKQRDEDTLIEPKGMQAHVPHQPNHCDCGVYLLHFAKTFMKDPKLSSEIIQNRSSPQKGRRVHEHWDDALVVHYRDELAARIHLLSDEWKRQRSEQDAATAKAKNQIEAAAAAPQEQQSSTDQTPAASSKADNDSDSEIEVLVSPKKATTSKATSRRYSGLADYSKRGAAARMRGG